MTCLDKQKYGRSDVVRVVGLGRKKHYGVCFGSLAVLNPVRENLGQLPWGCAFLGGGERPWSMEDREEREQGI